MSRGAALLGWALSILLHLLGVGIACLLVAPGHWHSWG